MYFFVSVRTFLLQSQEPTFDDPLPVNVRYPLVAATVSCEARLIKWLVYKEVCVGTVA